MTYPFDPRKTYTDNSVPKVTAGDLTAFQAADNAMAWRTYLSRPEVRMSSTNGTSVDAVVSPMMIRDTATSQYTYCAWSDLVITTSSLDAPAMAWPTSKWLYVYVYCTNGVGSVEASETAPTVITPDGSSKTMSPLFKTGDETRRYIGSFYSNGSSVLRRFSMFNGLYTYLAKQVALAVTTAGAGYTTWNVIDLSEFVPPKANLARILAGMANKANTVNNLLLSPDGGIDPIEAIITSTWEGAGYSYRVKQGTVDVPLLGSQSVQVQIGTANASIQLKVLGYVE